MSALTDACKKYRVGEPDSESLLSVYRVEHDGDRDEGTYCDTYSTPMSEQDIAVRHGNGNYEIDVLGYDPTTDDHEVLEDTICFSISGWDWHSKEDPREAAGPEIEHLVDLVGAVHDILWDENHRGEDIEAMARRVKKERDRARRTVEAQGLLANGREETISQYSREVGALRHGAENTAALVRKIAAQRDALIAELARASRYSSENYQRGRHERGWPNIVTPITPDNIPLPSVANELTLTRDAVTKVDARRDRLDAALVQIANETTEYAIWTITQRALDPDAESYTIPKRLVKRETKP